MIENQKDKTGCSSSDIGRSFYSFNSSLTLVYINNGTDFDKYVIYIRNGALEYSI